MNTMTNALRTKTADLRTRSPRIYVASLRDYNEGRLVGSWIDLDADMRTCDLLDEIREIMADAAGDEWALHDFEYVPETICKEWTSAEGLERLLLYTDLRAEVGAAAEAYVDAYGDDVPPADWLGHFADTYAGSWRSATDYAAHYVDRHFDVPDFVRAHVDLDSVRRELEITHVFARRGLVHVFRDV